MPFSRCRFVSSSSFGAWEGGIYCNDDGTASMIMFSDSQGGGTHDNNRVDFALRFECGLENNKETNFWTNLHMVHAATCK